MFRRQSTRWFFTSPPPQPSQKRAREPIASLGRDDRSLLTARNRLCDVSAPDDGWRAAPSPAPAQALHRAERDELDNGLAEAGQDRSSQEDDDGGLEEDL